MFSYYGAKTKIINLYPEPIYNKIVEPFAGSARYSLKYFDKEIILYETFEKVFKIWEYLLQATEKDILSLPDVNTGDNIKDYKTITDVERWLIGYHVFRGSARPCYQVRDSCNWNKDKIRIANNLYKIKHWKIFNEDGLNHEWKDATYFVDPPYMVQSHKYNHYKMDYNRIKEKLKGDAQFIVCGNSNDTWLDFKPLIEMRGTNKKHIECIWVNT